MIVAVNVYAGVQGEQRRMLKSQEMWLQVASSPQRWWKPNSSPLEECQLLINADPSLSRGFITLRTHCRFLWKRWLLSKTNDSISLVLVQNKALPVQQ